MTIQEWIHKVDQLVMELDEKPQFGLPAPFDWKGFERHLQEVFARPDLTVTHEVKGWMAKEDALLGLGEELLPLKVAFSPLVAPAYFVTTEGDLKQLMADLLGGEKEAAYFYDSALTFGFYHYLGASVLNALEEYAFAPPLSPRLGEMEMSIEHTLGDEPAYVIDVGLNINGHTYWGKCLAQESFRRDWKSYFVNQPTPPLSDEMREQLMVDVSIEVGATGLSFADWKKAEEGDFILLDHCSYDPVMGKGSVILSLQGRPLFRGRYKDRGIKLTEYPLYEEVSGAMEEEEEERDEDLYGEEEEVEEESVELTHAEPALTPEDLPINLTVEVGRLRMSAKELMELAPGNVIDVNAAPEQGVDLVVNGKKVGRGELVRLGETLGVRIVSLP